MGGYGQILTGRLSSDLHIAGAMDSAFSRVILCFLFPAPGAWRTYWAVLWAG